MKRAAMFAVALLACRRSETPATPEVHTANGAVAAPTAPSFTDTLPSTARADSFALYPAARLASVAHDLATARSSGRTIGGREDAHYVQSRRVTSGTPEVHDDWVDVTVVQAGGANLLVGGRVSGGQQESAGEHRGGTIVGGSMHPLGAGDLLIVPAGVPHQYVLAAGDSIIYLTTKVRRSRSRD